LDWLKGAIDYATSTKNQTATGMGVPGPAACFLPGTSILTADGRQIVIEHVVIGMNVRSLNVDTGEYVPGKVISVNRRYSGGYYSLRLSTGDCVDVTGEHPFYTPTLKRTVEHIHGNFTRVKHLQLGDEIQLYIEGQPVLATLVETLYWDEPSWVYNFVVDGQHTYIANNIVVHNKTGFAEGGIINRPVFSMAERGAEVVAPLQDLMSLIRQSMSAVVVPYLPQQQASTNYNTTNQYNLTTQSINQPNTLGMEFRAMELAHL